MKFSDIRDKIFDIIMDKLVTPAPCRHTLVNGFFMAKTHNIFPSKLTAEREEVPMVAIKDSNNEVHFFFLKDLLPDLDVDNED